VAASRYGGAAISAAQRSPQSTLQFPIPKLTELRSSGDFSVLVFGFIFFYFYFYFIFGVLFHSLYLLDSTKTLCFLCYRGGILKR